MRPGVTPDRRFVVALGFVWAVVGLVEPHLPAAGAPRQVVGLVHGIAMSVLLFGWCKAHAQRRGIRPPRGAAFLFGLFPPFALPYYAYRGFGFRAGTRLLLGGLLTFVALCIVYVVAFSLSGKAGALN